MPARDDFPRKLQPVSVLAALAILFGLVMPIVSALVYPTYVHRMPLQWVETTRLLELPFVAAEIVVILWAMRKGLDSAGMFRKLPKDVQIAAMVLIFGIFASSIFISKQPGYSLTISLISIIHLYFALAITHLLRIHGDLGGSRFLGWHGVGLIALAMLTAWWFAFPPPESEVLGGKIEWDSALPGFIHLRHFGSWTGAIAAGFAITILYRDRPDRLDANHLFYFIAATMTVWSGTRAAILAMVVVFVLFVVTLRKMPSFRAIGRAALLTGLALCSAWLLLPAAELHNAHMFRLFNFGESESLNRFTSGRDVIWGRTIERWLESPLLGLGSGSTLWELGLPWPHTQPHNAPLQFLISWGAVGTMGAVWLIGRGVRAAHSVVVARPELLGLLAMLYALLVQSLFEGMLHYPRFIIAIVLILALTLHMGNASNRAGQPATSPG